MASDDIVGIEVESGVSMFNGKPFVNLKLNRKNLKQDTFQVRPDKAREVALMILEAADASEMDVAFVAAMKSMDFDEETAHRMLQAIREHRP